MFWGFCVLFLGTVLATIDYDITLRLRSGSTSSCSRGRSTSSTSCRSTCSGSSSWSGSGSRSTAASSCARPGSTRPPHFAWVLALLFVINVTGLRPGGVPAGGREAVVGARGRRSAGRSARASWRSGWARAALRGLHLGTWLFHFAISFAFIALIPHSYFVHLITTPLNIFFVEARRRAGALKPIPNIEEAESARRLEARGVLLEAAARLRRVHRCAAAARTSARRTWRGRALQPEADHPEAPRAHARGERPAPSTARRSRPRSCGRARPAWRACEECPAFIDIVDTIVDLRRYLALSEGALPGDGAA